MKGVQRGNISHISCLRLHVVLLVNASVAMASFFHHESFQNHNKCFILGEDSGLIYLGILWLQLCLFPLCVYINKCEHATVISRILILMKGIYVQMHFFINISMV